MNKIAKRITALSLCAAVGFGIVCAASAQTTGKSNTAETNDKDVVAQTKSVSQKASKDETVYVLAGADGSVQKIIVSDWIKNEMGSDAINDKSDLSNIENVKGNEDYSINSSDMKVWDAQGNDIYYQGDIEKELPVDLLVSYQLDGKNVSAEDLAGKSGKVTIHFAYRNRQYEMVEIDGKKEKIYVPFAMLTGMMLDNDIFHNVEISNGKLINDGERTIVAGLAFPGLQENLALSKESFDIPDYVEITADVTNFSSGMTITIATNEVFNELDTQKIGSADDLNASLTELADAMTQLTDGSSALYSGLCTLLDKSNELVSGINQLVDGAEAIKNGADSLDDGAAQLKAGLTELSAGLNTLSDNSASLNNGAEQVFNTLLATAAQQIRAAGISIPDLTISNYAEALGDLISSLDQSAVYDQALVQVTTAVEAKRPEISEKVTAVVRENVSQQVAAATQTQISENVAAEVKAQVTQQVISSATGLDKDAYEAAIAAGEISEKQQDAINAAVADQMESEQIQGTITTTVNSKMQSDEVQAMIAANIENQMQSADVQATISQNVEIQIQQAISENMQSQSVQSKIATASEGAKTIIELKTSLDSYNAFYLGLLSYTDGVNSAASGADQLSVGASTLKDGTAQLKSGADTLYSGVLKMKNGAPALVDGVTQLRDGAMELSDGLKQFNEQGIQKIVDFMGDDLAGTVARLKATIDVSKDYRNFSGLADDMNGQVKFIYRTDEIEAD